MRYQFPYTEVGRRVPDPPEILQATVRAAIEIAAFLYPQLPLLAGGKSMGGRMTSSAASTGDLVGVRGLVFLGFPLHPPRKPSVSRGAHLSKVKVPMLFLQGTRDELATFDLLKPVIESLGERATLHVVDGADHSFDVLKRSGRTSAQVIDELATQIALWGRHVVDARGGPGIA
jgi:predicted alpha/beta-hydrolase family hydrolase